MQPAHNNQEGRGEKPRADVPKQTQEQKEFAEMAASLEKGIFGYLLSRVKNRSDALELTQQTFHNAWKAWPRLSKSDKTRAWFIAIAENLAIDHNRRATAKKRGKPQSLDAMPGQVNYDGDAPGKFDPKDYRADGSAHELLEAKEERAALESAIPLLNGEEQRLIRLHFANKSYAEIAEETGRTVTAIGPALTRARAKLIEIVKSHDSSGSETAGDSRDSN